MESGERPIPEPGPGQVLVRVRACGVCRTDLHIVDDELPDVRVPIVPGHEVIGTVEHLEPGSSLLTPGQRVGIPWLGFSCALPQMVEASLALHTSLVASGHHGRTIVSGQAVRRHPEAWRGRGVLVCPTLADALSVLQAR